MTLKNNDITLAIAVLMIVIIGWTSRGNLVNHSRERVIEELSVNELDTITRCAVRVDTSLLGLTIYFPATDSIVLRCFEPPIPDNDSSIVFCCAAAFTRYDRPHNNNHLFIAGDHVCSGERKRGYSCTNNTGAFVFYNGEWKFLLDKYSHELDSAALYKGSGFAQEMLIHEGRPIKTVRRLSQVEQYRALCQLNGELCVIDAREPQPFGDFINTIMDAGVEEALYLDMGEWHYSWYRKCLGIDAIPIHSDLKETATNWLLFYVTR